MKQVWEFVCGACGVAAMVLTFKLATETVDRVQQQRIALMLPLSGEFSRDSRDMQRAAELALKTPTAPAAILRVYNIPPTQTDEEPVADRGTEKMLADFKAGAINSIYGYQSTRQMRLALDLLTKKFNEAPCEAPLNIHTVSVTTKLQEHRCYRVHYHGGVNDALARAAAQFVADSSECVAFLYKPEDPYAQDLVDKTRMHLYAAPRWIAQSAESTSDMCDPDDAANRQTSVASMTPKLDDDAASSADSCDPAGLVLPVRERILDINSGERASAACASQSVLFAVTEPSRFFGLLQRAKDLGFSSDLVLGADSLLSREFLFSTEYTSKLDKLKFSMLLPRVLGDREQLAQLLGDAHHYVPGFADTNLFNLIVGASTEPVPRVVEMKELRLNLQRSDHEQ